jgi:hypothetical protein
MIDTIIAFVWGAWIGGIVGIITIALVWRRT